MDRVNNIKNGLIVVGKIGGKAEQDAVILLGERLGWPVFADASSGLRLGRSDEGVIHYFDGILSSQKFTGRLKFDGILYLGGRLTSKRYYEFVSKLSLKEYLMVLDHPLRNDPGHQVSLRIEAPVKVFCEAVSRHIKNRKATASLRALVKANRDVNDIVEKVLDADKKLGAVHAARLITQNIPEGSGLFLGNSMPVRDVGFYGDPKGPSVSLHGNRGASGIDGNLASAAGLSAGLDRPVTLFIGDLALLHDLNSLAMTKGLKHPVVIVVVNNDGGAIFSFLPIAQSNDVFEKFFSTPHGLSFEDAATMFGLSYMKPETNDQFLRAYQEAFQKGCSTVIEVVTDKESHLRTHKDIQARIAKVLTQ